MNPQGFCLLSFFETASHYVALAILELTEWTRLASNSPRAACLCLLSAGIKGVPHHAWPLVSVVINLSYRLPKANVWGCLSISPFLTELGFENSKARKEFQALLPPLRPEHFVASVGNKESDEICQKI